MSILPKIKTKLRNMTRDIFINGTSSSKITPKSIRYLILKAYGIDIKTKNISPGCFFGNKKITIGKGTFINYECFFDNTGEIVIGDNCLIAMQVMFCTSSHIVGSEVKRGGQGYNSPIEIGDGCWLGARSLILPGVTIGSGCVIAAGAVVNNDCEPNGLYAGVPAKRIKELNDDDVEMVQQVV